MNQISRKKTRRFLLQILYSRIYGDIDMQRFYVSYFEGILDFEIDTNYLESMQKLVIEHQKEIVSIIIELAPKFDIETMLKTNILALAISITEMLWFPDEIPAKVSLNEAIDIAKYYGDESSKNIVNGILHSFLKNITKYQKSIEISEKSYDFFP